MLFLLLFFDVVVHYSLGLMTLVTVNMEIFARILFSRIALKEIFAM